MQFHRCKTTTLPLLHPIKCFSRKRTLTIVLLYWQEEDTFRRSLGADRFILPMTSLAAKNHFLCSANRPDRFGPIMNTNQVCTWVDLKLYENKTWLLYAFVLLERRSDFALGCCLYVYLHHGSLNRTCTLKIFPKPITSPTRPSFLNVLVLSHPKPWLITWHCPGSKTRVGMEWTTRTQNLSCGDRVRERSMLGYTLLKILYIKGIMVSYVVGQGCDWGLQSSCQSSQFSDYFCSPM